MPTPDTEAVQQVVLAFPALASYLLVLFVFLLIIIAWKYGQSLLKRFDSQDAKIIQRLDSQDAKLESIEKALVSEVKLMGERMHDIDKRVIRIESHCSMFHGHAYKGNE